MHRLGFHISISGGIEKSFERAHELGCNTMQIFSRNPRGWGNPPLTLPTIEAWQREKSEYSEINPIIIHMPYLPNLAADNPEQREKSYQSLVQELQRASLLGVPYVCTHLGKSMGANPVEKLRQVAKLCDQALAEKGTDGPLLLLENTAGQGSEIGTKMEEIAYIFQHAQYSERLGLCLDTCHAHAAGYDLSSPTGFDHLLTEIERYIGWERVYLVHLNDSMKPAGSHIDRHQHITQGTIGRDGIKRILFHPRLAKLPFIMETPVNEDGDDQWNLKVVQEILSEG